MSTPQPLQFVGIDIAKTSLVVATARSIQDFDAKTLTFSYTVEGLAKLTTWLNEQKSECVCFEGTGGYEFRLIHHLAENHPTLKRCLASPRRSREFMNALGHKAKNDAQDARGLARFAASGLLDTSSTVSEAQLLLRQATLFRAQLVKERTAWKNRKDKAFDTFVTEHIEEMVCILDGKIEDVEARMHALVEEDERMREVSALLQQIPGIGKVTAAIVIAETPELGQVPNAKLSSLVGLAPHARDSGKSRGVRRTGPGRDALKRALWLASMHAERLAGFAEFKTRLLAQGKPKSVVRVALMRKLLCLINAIVRDKSVLEESKLMSQVHV